MLGSAPGLGRRAVHIVAAGPRAEGERENCRREDGRGWGYAELGPGCCVSLHVSSLVRVQGAVAFGDSADGWQ